MTTASSPSGARPASDHGEAADAAPTPEPHDPASKDKEGSESTPAPRKLWTAGSPFFDGLTMSAIVLDRLQEHIRFDDGPLYCLHVKDQVPSTKKRPPWFVTVADLMYRIT